MHRSIIPFEMKHNQVSKSFYMRNLLKYKVSQASTFQLTNYDQMSEINSSHLVLKLSSLVCI